MLRVRIVASSLLMLFPALGAWADDAPAPPPPQDVWIGKGQLGRAGKATTLSRAIYSYSAVFAMNMICLTVSNTRRAQPAVSAISSSIPATRN